MVADMNNPLKVTPLICMNPETALHLAPLHSCEQIFYKYLPTFLNPQRVHTMVCLPPPANLKT